MRGYVIQPDMMYNNNFQLPFEGDKIQLEGQENEIGYSNVNGDYLSV